MRKLRLNDAALRKLLGELDAQDARPDAGRDAAGEFHSYRIPGLRVDVDLSRDESDALIVPSRKLGSAGIYFLASNLLHTDCVCRVHLVTVRNNWQTVSGRVAGCRYIAGTTGVHEIFVRFDHPIDPASFAPTATRSRILAVDDSRVSLKLYEHLLQTMNVELTCACNGIEAIETALANTYDLILMDLEMPEMDGLSAVQTLRSRGYVRSIVAVSAMCEPEDRARCLAAGCDDFLAKPLTRETLSAVVDRNRAEPLVSAFLDDPGMTDLIDGFVAGLGETVNRLEAAYGTQNYSELEREARQLKGEAAGIGFGAITDAAIAIEHALKRGDDDTVIRGKLTELIRLCMSARPATSRRAESPAEQPAEAEAAKPEPRPTTRGSKRGSRSKST
ncbi:MAG TPA: response regulator [Phycisphaerae bacterium]|mgnify:CR=1 FL=1|nr:response regulator [Phycisphaerae bacterium]